MGTTERIELPDDDWAEIRDPRKVPERLRRPVREAAINLQRSLPEDQRRGTVKVEEPLKEAEEETQSAFGAPPIDGLVEEVESISDLPFLPSTEQQGFVDDYNEALLLSVVTAWSFGEVTREVLQDIPGDAFDELLDTVRKLGAKEGSSDSLADDPS